MSEREFDIRTIASRVLSLLAGMAVAWSFIFAYHESVRPALLAMATGLALVFLYANNSVALLAGAGDHDQIQLRRRLDRLEFRR